MCAAPDIYGDRKIPGAGSFNQLTAKIPRSIFIEHHELKFLFFLKQLL
jgi:hypothetical protein